MWYWIHLRIYSRGLSRGCSCTKIRLELSVYIAWGLQLDHSIASPSATLLSHMALDAHRGKARRESCVLASVPFPQQGGKNVECHGINWNQHSSAHRGARSFVETTTRRLMAGIISFIVPARARRNGKGQCRSRRGKPLTSVWEECDFCRRPDGRGRRRIPRAVYLRRIN